MKQIMTVMVLVAFLLSVSSCTAAANPPDFGGCERCHADIAENFNTSLHHTGSGMYEEYERGAAGHFDIDMCDYYDKFNCSKCHAVTCTSCHVGENMFESHRSEITVATCDPCHKKKQTSTYAGEMPMHKPYEGNADIHYEMGFMCQDCHNAEELHGTGVKYDTQLAATTTECEDCHVAFKTSIEAHTIHEGKLKCITCHTGWSLTCNECHLETRQGMKPVGDEFYLGIADDGMVTTFLKMDAEYKGDVHTGYGEWFSHTITSEAKDCAFCHENPAVLCDGVEIDQMVGEGGSMIPQAMIDRVLAVDIGDRGVVQDDKPGYLSRFGSWISGLWT